MGKCELIWCGRNGVSLIYVNENIGDGSWRVGICHKCAGKLRIKAGDDLPPAHQVKALITTSKGGS